MIREGFELVGILDPYTEKPRARHRKWLRVSFKSKCTKKDSQEISIHFFSKRILLIFQQQRRCHVHWPCCMKPFIFLAAVVHCWFAAMKDDVFSIRDAQAQN